jgi:hypothetical protein
MKTIILYHLLDEVHVTLALLWNEFVNPIKLTCNKNTFKKGYFELKLKEYFMDKLLDNYQCDHLPSHLCHL